jgi:hypothetical protein
MEAQHLPHMARQVVVRTLGARWLQPILGALQVKNQRPSQEHQFENISAHISSSSYYYYNNSNFKIRKSL